MQPTFRKSMAWLHTWAGVVIGSILFAIFFMGSLSVFDREIDRWMMPATRLAVPADPAPVRLDGPIVEQALRLGKGSPQVFMRLPDERTPAVQLRWRDEASKTFQSRFAHPRTGELLEHTDTLAGTGFIFPFHFKLHIAWLDIGYWLVGLAGMAMMVLVVSGVVIHRKIFADFFLFRPRKQLQRASLDLHNLTGVLALPFHFMIALSGLVIFMGIYFPTAYQGAYGADKEAKAAYSREAYGQFRRPKSGTPAQASASIDAMRQAASAQWQGGEANFVRIWHPGDANSYVELRRSYQDMVTMNIDQMYFDAATGAVLYQFEAAPVMSAQRFISGLHFIQFRHWTLRWLYFVAGLAGCILIATGFLFWLESRRANHAKHGLPGVRIVEALAVCSVPGLMAATCAFFIANRLLPLDAAWAGWDRSELEVWGFYLAWLASLGHAAWRGRAAWREQACAIAALAPLAVVLNALTTGQHPVRSLQQGLWGVAGVDLVLLAAGALAAWAVHRMGRRAAARKPAVARTASATPQAATGAEHHA